MGENTKIAWAHHTFNPWIGCTKVAPECDNCYAEGLMDLRYHRAQWGAGNPRVRTSADNWRKPLRWDRMAGEAGVRYRVFCASLADVFDNEVDPQWRDDLWALMRSTKNIDWLLLTKRIGNVKAMIPEDWDCFCDQVWLGITTGTQAAMDRDAPKMKGIAANVHWLSVEPMLERIEPKYDLYADWIVCGGESGRAPRALEVDWALELRHWCANNDRAFFMKQGSAANWPAYLDFDSFPKALQVREFPHLVMTSAPLPVRASERPC